MRNICLNRRRFNAHTNSFSKINQSHSWDTLIFHLEQSHFEKYEHTKWSASHYPSDNTAITQQCILHCEKTRIIEDQAPYNVNKYVTATKYVPWSKCSFWIICCTVYFKLVSINYVSSQSNICRKSFNLFV